VTGEGGAAGAAGADRGKGEAGVPSAETRDPLEVDAMIRQTLNG
jgi:hypothetical protein